MIPKWFIYPGFLSGSSVGAWVPTFWGAGMLSLSSFVFSAIGGIAGIVVAVKIGNSM
jgi:hypothetical protein